jgi:predicted permease
MKKKLLILSNCSFVLADAIFIFSYFLFHYATPDGSFTTVYQTVANKPVITLLFAIWGVFFLFSGVMSCLIAFIFFKNEKK